MDRLAQPVTAHLAVTFRNLFLMGVRFTPPKLGFDTLDVLHGTLSSSIIEFPWAH